MYHTKSVKVSSKILYIYFSIFPDRRLKEWGWGWGYRYDKH